MVSDVTKKVRCGNPLNNVVNVASSRRLAVNQRIIQPTSETRTVACIPGNLKKTLTFQGDPDTGFQLPRPFRTIWKNVLQ